MARGNHQQTNHVLKGQHLFALTPFIFGCDPHYTISFNSLVGGGGALIITTIPLFIFLILKKYRLKGTAVKMYNSCL